MSTRNCKKCKETKALDDFPVYNKEKGYRRYECAVCDKKRIADAHARTIDRRLQRARDRYAQNPAAVWTPERRKRANEIALGRYARLRDQMFEKIGPFCRACGETEPLFLTIDHINNDGWERRKEPRSREIGVGLYTDIIRDGLRGDLECLCFNCNFGKRRNGGVLVKDRRREGKSND